MKILNQDLAKNYQRPSLNRGHIVFTSLLKFQHKILFLDAHIERLLKGAHFLFPEYQWPQNYETIKAAVLQELKDAENASLRVTIFDDVLYFEKRAFELSSATLKMTSAIKLKTPGLLPAYLKHSNYLEIDLELTKARKLGFDDVLFFDYHQNAAEASTSNLFVVTALGDIKTPPACSYVLEGITRGKLSECLKKNGHQVVEQFISMTDLENATEIWLTNAVKGLRFVSQFQDKLFQIEGSQYEKIVGAFGRYGEKYE